MIPTTIFTSQLLLVLFKHLVVRGIQDKEVVRTMIFTAFVQICWLISSALGINAFLEDDYLSMLVYVLGGVVGAYLQFKIKGK